MVIIKNHKESKRDLDPSIAVSAVPKGLTTEGLLSRRYGARVIDNLILLVLAAILMFPISIFMRSGKDSIVSSALLGIVVLTRWCWSRLPGRLHWARSGWV